MSQAITLLDRAYGTLAGLAIGDAMGMPTSFLSDAEIRSSYGKIEGFQPPLAGHIYHAGLRAGEVTDDTEQSLALAKSFLRYRRVEPEDIVRELLEWAKRVENKYASPFGPSTKQALEQIAQGESIFQAGMYGDTNGAAMRIAPLGIIHGTRGSTIEETVRDVVWACLPTHGAQVAISAAAAVAWAVALCFRGESNVEGILQGAEEAACLASQYGNFTVAPSVAHRIAWISEQVSQKKDAGMMLDDMYQLFGGGVESADSIPIALGIFALFQGDPRRIVLAAANQSGDADTIGAIAGAIGGAFSGISAVPEEWIAQIEQMNQLDLRSKAELLVRLGSVWQVSPDPGKKKEAL